MKYNRGNYEKYLTKNPLKRRMVNRLNQKIIDSVGNFIEKTGKNARILDAGCGEGFIDALLIEKYPDIQITGVEYAPEAIEIARKMNPDVCYIQDDITSLHLEDDQFDIVICTEVLEHISRPETAFSEILRVAKKFLLITVPHEPFFCMGNMLVLKNVKRLGNPVDHVNHWTKRGFQQFLRNHLTVEERFVVSTSFPWLAAEIYPDK